MIRVRNSYLLNWTFDLSFFSDVSLSSSVPFFFLDPDLSSSLSFVLCRLFSLPSWVFFLHSSNLLYRNLSSTSISPSTSLHSPSSSYQNDSSPPFCHLLGLWSDSSIHQRISNGSTVTCRCSLSSTLRLCSLLVSSLSLSPLQFRIGYGGGREDQHDGFQNLQNDRGNSKVL